MPQTSPPTLDDLLTHASFVRAVARAAVRGDADVDDVVQATWLAAVEIGPRHGGSPRGWLATVARNAARGLKRGEGRRHEREARGARPEGLPSTAEIAAREEVRRKLLQAVLGLDEPYRSAVLLRYYEDLPPRKVAERLGVPVETARTRVKRGLAQLRTRLDDRWAGDRRAWAVAVAPLAGVGLGGVAKAAGLGLVAKAAAAVLAIGLLGSVGRYAIDRTKTAPVEPDPVELAAGDDAADGPVLRPASRSAVRGGGTIRGTVARDGDQGEVQVEAARIGPLDLVDQRTSMVNPGSLLSPPLMGDVVATSTADADGSFRLVGLAQGLYLVAARAPDGPARVALAALLADRGETQTSLDLRRGPHTLTGRVTNADGAPCSGWVYLQRIPAGPVSGATLTWPQGSLPRRLADDGGFRFEHLAEGRVALVVVEPGVRLLRRDEILVPFEGLLELVLGSKEKKRGLVVDAVTGDGIADAQAFVFTMLRGDVSFFLTSTRSNGEGRLELDDLGRKIDALVTADGYTPARASWRLHESETTIELERVAGFQGRVVDEEGAVLGGVTVHAYALERRGLDFGRGIETTSDATGGFHLPSVAPGEVMVFAHGGGYTSARLAEVKEGGFNPYVHTATSGALNGIELVAVPAGAVEGRVVGTDGRGLAGLALGIVGEPWPDLRGPGLRPRGLPWTTDDEGRFHIDTVLPGEELRVVAMTPEGGRFESEPFSLVGGATHTVTLTAGAAQYVDVRVVDEDGAPVADVRVLVVQSDPSGRKMLRLAGTQAVTDAAGRYPAGPLAPSDLGIHVDTDDYLESGVAMLTAAHRAGDEALEIVLSKGLSIAGRVTGPAGLDLTTVTVDLEAQRTARVVRRSIQADAAGAFRFDLLPEHTYALEASAGFDGHGWKARATVEDTSQPVRLELVRGAKLRVPTRQPSTDRVRRWAIHVRGPDGEPIPEAAHRQYDRFPGQPWHYAGYGRGRELRVQTHVSGTDETYVEVFAARDERDRPLPLGAALVLPSDLPVGGGEHTVTLPPEQVVRGRIVGPDGEGVAGVPIEAFGDYGTHQLPIASHDPHARTRSGSDGAFELRQLGPFAYVLRLDLPEAFAPHGDVSVHAGDEDAVIRVRASASTRVRVLDEEGRVIPGAHVQLAHGTQTHAASLTDAEGLFIARGLDPDLLYRITARMPEGTSRYLVTVLEEQAPGEIEAVLRSAHTVSGVVVAPDGRSLPWARVYRQVSENGWETHFADEAGRFTLQGLPAGDLVLMVAPALPFRWFEGTRHTVRAPASDLSLEAEVGGGITFRLPADVKPEEASIGCTDQDDALQRAHFHPQMLKQRTDTIHGLDPGHRYVLYVIANERVFLAADLRPGPEVVEITLAPWRTLTVRVDLPGGLPEGLGWENVSLTAEGTGWQQYGRLVDPTGPTWEIMALPPGACTVRARLERWARTSNDPSVPPQRIGRRYAGVAEQVTTSEVRLTLRETAD